MAMSDFQGTIESYKIQLKGEKKVSQVYGLCACVDPETHDVFVIGGFDKEGDGTKECYKINMKSNEVSSLPIAPEGRLFGACSMNKKTNEIFVYSGLDEDGSFFCDRFFVFTTGGSENSQEKSNPSWEFVGIDAFEGFTSLNLNKMNEVSSISMTSSVLRFPQCRDRKLPVFVGWNEDKENRDSVMGDTLYIIIFDIHERKIIFHQLPPLKDEIGINFGCIVDHHFYCLKNRKRIKSDKQEDNASAFPKFPEPKLIRVDVLDPMSKGWEDLEVQGEGNPNSYLTTFTALEKNRDKIVCFGGTNSKGSTLDLYNNKKKKNIHLLCLKTMMWRSFLLETDFPICRFGYGHFAIENRFYVLNGIYTKLEGNEIFQDLICFDFGKIVSEEGSFKDTIIRIEFLKSQLSYEDDDDESEVYGKKFLVKFPNRCVYSYFILFL